MPLLGKQLQQLPLFGDQRVELRSLLVQEGSDAPLGINGRQWYREVNELAGIDRRIADFDGARDDFTDKLVRLHRPTGERRVQSVRRADDTEVGRSDQLVR